MEPDRQIASQNPIDIVLATRNAGKVKEMQMLLRDVPVILRSVSEFGSIPDIVEDQTSLQGNAIKKAQAVYDLTGVASLADDTGLEVDALGGRPGVQSARYAGEHATDIENRALLLEEMEGAATRSARFCTVAAYVDGVSICLFEGICEGSIRLSEAGVDGFGYDALFQPNGYDQSFAEMPTETKNGISHRGQALAKFKAYMLERTAVRG
jgi:XTP/dITP diphosphohydrolase